MKTVGLAAIYRICKKKKKKAPLQDLLHNDFLLIQAGHVEEAADAQRNDVASLHQHGQVERPLVAARGIRKRRKQKRVSK